MDEEGGLTMRQYAPIQLDFQWRRIPPMEHLQKARIPWEEHLKIYSNYPDSQTAERIAERGGFGVNEAINYYGWDNPAVIEFSNDGETWQKIKLDFKNEGIYWELYEAEALSVKETLSSTISSHMPNDIQP